MEFKRCEWKLCRRSRLLQSSLAFIRRALASISPPLGQPVRLLCFIANGHKANWLIVLVSMLLLPAVSLDLHAQEKVASHKPTRFSVSRFVASGNTLRMPIATKDTGQSWYLFPNRALRPAKSGYQWSKGKYLRSS